MVDIVAVQVAQVTLIRRHQRPQLLAVGNRARRFALAGKNSLGPVGLQLRGCLVQYLAGKLGVTRVGRIEVVQPRPAPAAAPKAAPEWAPSLSLEM